MEADDLSHTAGNKGQAHTRWEEGVGAPAAWSSEEARAGPGHYDKDRPAIIAWVSRQGPVVMHAVKDFPVKTVQKAAKSAPCTRAVGCIRTPPAAIGR